MSTDQEIIDQYSRPGLKTNQLSRYGKKWHLKENYKMSKPERDALLDKLYGAENVRETESPL